MPKVMDTCHPPVVRRRSVYPNPILRATDRASQAQMPGVKQIYATAHNIEVGKRHFDFNVLQGHLAEGGEWAARRAGG